MADSQKKGSFKKFFRFKGFGSLSTLPRAFSFRRVSVAPSTPETHGGGLLSSNSFLEPTFESTQDDLQAMPKSPSPYARSCDMYSHMGTMPRATSGRSKKEAKAKSKAKGTPNGKTQGEAQEPHSLVTTPALRKVGPLVEEDPGEVEKELANHHPYCSQTMGNTASKSLSETGQGVERTQPKLKRNKRDPLPVPGKLTLQSTQDDLVTVPQSPSPYARSCDMYTYTGTMPRTKPQQSTKPAKANMSPEGQSPDLVPPTPQEHHSMVVGPVCPESGPLAEEEPEQKEKVSLPLKANHIPACFQTMDNTTKKSLPEAGHVSEASKEKTKRNKQDSLLVPGKLTLENTQDDLMIGLQSPSPYAHLCDMYSHTGTMPRQTSGQSQANERPTGRTMQEYVRKPGEATQECIKTETPIEPVLSGGQVTEEEIPPKIFDERHQEGLESGSEYVKVELADAAIRALASQFCHSTEIFT